MTKITDFQKQALRMIDEIKYTELTRRQVTSLTKAGYIESENGEYWGLTEEGIQAISQINRDDIYNRVMSYDLDTLIDQLGLHFQHSYYVEFDILNCADGYDEDDKEDYIRQMKQDLIHKMYERII